MGSSTEQRKYKRHKVPEGASVITPYSICHLIDVSSGGMLLECHENVAISKEFCLDILAGENNYYAQQIPVKLVWEERVNHPNIPNLILKRLGVEFGNIKGQKKDQLDNFIIKQETIRG